MADIGKPVRRIRVEPERVAPTPPTPKPSPPKEPVRKPQPVAPRR
jgi:hypothetical protein